MESREVRVYKEKVPKDLRKLKAQALIENYKEKVPIVLLKMKASRVTLKSSQLIAHRDMTISNLIFVLRRSINLPSNLGLYLFIEDIVPMLNSKVGELYQRFADDDGFLYILYSNQEDKG